ncbi:metallophosphoesterase family protein [Ectobacillus ponti]|uniref:Phosphoesterase n=1 Tax=Ectobacillus ponti TaxID=2961894 RepID=A0AA42BN67_9BACI|nr:metallophosphoesterase [Ectobacillus ponti]MCP8967347.1 metallophosphoesterase [Ectobacillus ponti]
MKVLIVSDSHGSTAELEQLKALHQQEAELMIHCGDSELGEADEALAGYTVVRGNCDWRGSFPNEIITEAGGLRFFVTHGHLYNIKMTLQTLLYKAMEQGARVACFGHSHVLGAEVINGVLLLNPGSILLPRGRKEKTYALLECKNGVIQVQFRELNGNVVAQQEFSLG